MSVRPVENDDPRLTREQSREIDQYAVDTLHIPGIVLMENAAINASDIALGLLETRGDDKPVAIICGGGNNGGDGYAVARHLTNAGTLVSIFCTAPVADLKGDAKTNQQICSAIGIPVHEITDADQLEKHTADWSESGLIIDAMLGTGFDAARGLADHPAAVIRAINAASENDSGPYVLAIDTPSGLDCETGKPSEETVRADATVTFIAPKIGFDADGADAFLGQLFVAGIGIPAALIGQLNDH